MAVEIDARAIEKFGLKKDESVMILFCQLSSGAVPPFVQIQSLVATFLENCRGIEERTLSKLSIISQYILKSGLNDRIKSFTPNLASCGAN